MLLRTVQCTGRSGPHGVQGQAEATVGDPVSDYSTFLDACLLLSPALPDAAIQPLLKAVTMTAVVKHAGAQKAAYRALARILSRRPAVLRDNIATACEVLLDSAQVHAAARRHRLACILPVLLLLASPERPDMSAVKLPEHEAQAPDKAMMSALVTELVLCTKEVNAKTRAQAYALLVDAAHALHAAHPPQLLSLDTGALLSLAFCVRLSVCFLVRPWFSTSQVAHSRFPLFCGGAGITFLVDLSLEAFVVGVLAVMEHSVRV